MRLIHTPEKFRFRQKWLENIILLKEKLAEGIDFWSIESLEKFCFSDFIIFFFIEQ